MCIIYREVLRNADFSAHLRLSEILAVAVADDNTFRYVCIKFICNIQCNIFMYTSTNIPTDSVFHYNFNINKATTIILRTPRIDILLNLFANKLLQKYNKRYIVLFMLQYLISHCFWQLAFIIRYKHFQQSTSRMVNIYQGTYN